MATTTANETTAQTTELKTNRSKDGKNVYSERLISPPGRLSYPFLFTRSISAEDQKQGKEGKYKCDLLIPKTTDISRIIEAVEKVGKEAYPNSWKGYKELKTNPIKDGDQLIDPETGDLRSEHTKGCWVITFKSNRKPGVVDARRRTSRTRTTSTAVLGRGAASKWEATTRLAIGESHSFLGTSRSSRTASGSETVEFQPRTSLRRLKGRPAGMERTFLSRLQSVFAAPKRGGGFVGAR